MCASLRVNKGLQQKSREKVGGKDRNNYFSKLQKLEKRIRKELKQNIENESKLISKNEKIEKRTTRKQHTHDEGEAKSARRLSQRRKEARPQAKIKKKNFSDGALRGQRNNAGGLLEKKTNVTTW